MLEAFIENGAAKVQAGKWLMCGNQPVASFDSFSQRSLKGFIVPDRPSMRLVETKGDSWCAAATRPFLTRLAALPDTSLNLVSAKLLVAPSESRVGSRNVKLVPMSFRQTTTVTEFRFGWVVAATASRVTHVSVADRETLMVRPEALVAWIGKDPSGFCPKLSAIDLILPRQPKNLAFSFHGPAEVWFEGGLDRSRKPRLRVES